MKLLIVIYFATLSLASVPFFIAGYLFHVAYLGFNTGRHVMNESISIAKARLRDQNRDTDPA